MVNNIVQAEVIKILYPHLWTNTGCLAGPALVVQQRRLEAQERLGDLTLRE